MKNFGKASTVQDLVNILYEIEGSHQYYGWDDGSIIIVNPETGDDIGYIEVGETTNAKT